MSGRTAQWSSPNHRPVRPNPVITSSAMSEHAMASTDVDDRRPVSVRRHGAGQGRADDRLGDERGHGPGAGRLDRPLELGGELVGGLERVRPGVAGTVGIGGAEVSEAAEPALVRAPERLASGQVEGADRVAVIAPPAAEHDESIDLAPGEVVGRASLSAVSIASEPPDTG